MPLTEYMDYIKILNEQQTTDSSGEINNNNIEEEKIKMAGNTMPNFH